MSDVTFVQSDSAPSLSGTLTDPDGNPINLTSASVKFQMRLADDRRYTVNSDAVVVSAAAGTVRYDWAAGDLATPGDYVCQWQITFAGGAIQTTDPANTITIRSE